MACEHQFSDDTTIPKCRATGGGVCVPQMDATALEGPLQTALCVDYQRHAREAAEKQWEFFQGKAAKRERELRAAEIERDAAEKRLSRLAEIMAGWCWHEGKLEGATVAGMTQAIRAVAFRETRDLIFPAAKADEENGSE